MMKVSDSSTGGIANATSGASKKTIPGRSDCGEGGAANEAAASPSLCRLASTGGPDGSSSWVRSTTAGSAGAAPAASAWAGASGAVDRGADWVYRSMAQDDQRPRSWITGSGTPLAAKKVAPATRAKCP